MAMSDVEIEVTGEVAVAFVLNSCKGVYVVLSFWGVSLKTNIFVTNICFVNFDQILLSHIQTKRIQSSSIQFHNPHLR